MIILTLENFAAVLGGVEAKLRDAGRDGILLKELEPVECYLSAITCAEGNAAIKNTDEGVRVVWLEVPTKKGLTILDDDDGKKL